MAKSDLPNPWTGTVRSVPMQVLVLGFPRTGTASMRTALEILGYGAVHHMQTVFTNPPEADMWTEALRARFKGEGTPYGRAEWDRLLGHCMAVTDTPSAAFAEDLITAYPEAKVILTNRDPQKWWVSFRDTILTTAASFKYRLAGRLDPRGLGRVAAMARLTIEAILGPEADVTQENATARFAAHYAHVRSLVPQGRLLEYEVQEGWGPLCEFLGKPVPDVEFPRTNDVRAFQEGFDTAVAAVIWKFAMRAVVLGVALAGAALAILCTQSRRR